LKKFCLLFLLFFCIQKGFSEENEIEKIQERKKIVIAMFKDDIFPFYFRLGDEKELDGVDIRLGKEIGKLLNVEVVLKRDYHTYEAIIDAVANKEVDLGISFLTKTVERCEKVFFTDPYIKTHLGLLINRKVYNEVKKTKSIVDNLNQKGNKIAALFDTSHYRFGEKIFSRATMQGYYAVQDSINAVKKGDVIAAIVNELELNAFIILTPEASLDIKTVFIEDHIEDIAIAINASCPHLKYWLDSLILSRKQLTVLELFHDYRNLLKEAIKREKLIPEN